MTLWQRFKSWLDRCVPEPETLEAVGWLIHRAGWLLLALVFITLIWGSGGIYGILGLSAAVGLLLLIGGGIWLALWLQGKLPRGLVWALLLLAVPVYAAAPFFVSTLLVLYAGLVAGLACVATGIQRGRRGHRISGRVLLSVGGVSLLVLSSGYLLTGWPIKETTTTLPLMAGERLQLADPAQPGAYVVETYSYGSGNDPHRDQFAEGADWLSHSVDGSQLLEGWEGLAGWARSGYWDVTAEELPVQGRVWAPEGDGPFALVLIVHGNHEMADYSDVGYGYLGELFASRGIITVSVDENFLNSSLADLLAGPDGGLEEESDARAWMLLQHLVQWRSWNEDPAHPMSGKVDLDRVVLIGHSRGGEAVSEAAVFNRLPSYPDDGTLNFDFDFGIRGIIAIAPVDHQYHPRDRNTLPRDVSFLVVHGSHDSDVDAFAGSAMYSRLDFPTCAHCFKSAFYLLGANHGQFNTSWGRYDMGFPMAKLLNVVPLMDPEEQRRVALVLFSAFLETVLHDQAGYRKFLARPERGAHWLPEGASWLSTYRDARQVLLVDFEEDADLTTGSGQAVRISGADLAIWKEAEVPLRWRDTDSAAVLLGWGNAETDIAPVYQLEFPEDTFWLAPDMTLSFAAAMGTRLPEGLEDSELPDELDFSIEFVDAAGEAAAVSLSERRPLFPQVDPVMYKLEALYGEAASEVVFQRYAFPISKWATRNPNLDISQLRQVRFVFPGDVPASLWLDNILVSPDGY